MKTVQHYLRKCDRERITLRYIREYGFDCELADACYSNVTIGDYIQKLRQRLNRMIDTIISVKPKTDNDKWILITTHAAPNNVSLMSGFQHLLVNGTEVMNLPADEIEDYGFRYAPFEYLASFYVADTYLTHYHLDDLLTFLLYEASWTGFDQEDLIKTLDEWDAEVSGDSAEKSVDTAEKSRDFEDTFEVKDPRHEAAYAEYSSASREYDNICRRIEFEKLKQLLL